MDFTRYKADLTGGVGIVADFTRATFIDFIDMQIMEVGYAVPEPGFRIGAFIISQRIGMAAKTESKPGFLIGLVQCIGKSRL